MARKSVSEHHENETNEVQEVRQVPMQMQEVDQIWVQVSPDGMHMDFVIEVEGEELWLRVGSSDLYPLDVEKAIQDYFECCIDHQYALAI